MFLLVFAVLSVLFYRSYVPGQIQFSNDGPFGRIAEECHRMPGRFFGCWNDLNTIGFREGAAPLSISYAFHWVLAPFLFAKFYAFGALTILGLGAWCFFRQAGLAKPACLLGGLAAALTSNFFSNACWGVAAHALTVGMSFFALAALEDTTSRRRWLKVPLAGLAVGMGVCEGDDVGALFSLLVAAYVFYRACMAEGSHAANISNGVLRVAVVAVFAGFMASATVHELVTTDIEGVVGTEQDAQTKAGRWDWATQWSLPKKELLGLVVPGLFGYRLDTPGGGNYWGEVGQDAGWRKWFKDGGQSPQPAKGFKRYVGGGFYAGVIVVLIAVWAALQALRRQASVFSASQRKAVWFWSVVVVVSPLLAFGRYAPLYRFVYALPYASTIRNPTKFLYFLNVALVVLFAFGVDGLWRRHLQPAATGLPTRWPGLKSWWTKASTFDKNWVRGCGIALAAGLVGWLIYSNASAALEQHLVDVLFAEPLAGQIASFSISRVGWSVLFFALSAGLVVLILSGAFAGRRARNGAIALGLLMVVDLGLANQPWIIYWDRDDKYSSNPIIDLLRDKPYEHRVAVVPISANAQPPNVEYFTKLYRVEWLQHQLPFFNIQSLDVVQMPRKQEDLAAFEKVFQPQSPTNIATFVTRRWELTNTRFVLGVANMLNFLNAPIADPSRHLHIVQRFNIGGKPGIAKITQVQQLTAVPDPNGPFALFEFPGALPRAKLYSNWQINTNHEDTRHQLVSPAFDPDQTVLVAGGVPAPSAGAGANAGTVEIASYAPKHLVLKSAARTPSVLLLNDAFEPNWHVTVDGKPASLLRCNYLMQGVYLLPGDHTVDFRFQPPYRLLYVSLAAIGVGVVLLGLVLAPARKSGAHGASGANGSAPAGRQPQPAPQPAQAAAATRQTQPAPSPRPKAARKAAADARRS